jgi:EmrB/QacA subfamily drug resistance transporter
MSDITFEDPTRAAATRRRWLALLVVLMAQLMVILDTTVVNVALPAIQTDLGVTQADLTWVLNGYLVSYGSLLLVAGRLGDLFGRRRMFLGGIALFTVASIACALADSVATLVAARFVQGVGGAFASSAVLAIIVAEFVDPVERGRAIGRYMLVSIGGGSLGLLLGGLLIQSLDWHWIFAINIPIGALALVGGVLLLDPQRSEGPRGKVDAVGAALVTVALLAGIDAIVRVADTGWSSPSTLGLGGASLVLLALFAVREARIEDPMVPPRILRLRSLISGSAVRAVLASGMYGFFFFATLHLQRVLGYDPLSTGLAFLPQTIPVAVMALGLSARLVARFGARRVLVSGMVIAVGGLLLLAGAGTDSGYLPWPAIAFVMIGVGMGGAFVPLTTLALSDVPPADAGLASGIVNVTMQISAAIGLAVLGTLAASRTAALGRAGRDPVAALAGGDRLGLLVAAGLVGVGIVLTLLLLRPQRTPAEGSAEVSSVNPATAPASLRAAVPAQPAAATDAARVAGTDGVAAARDGGSASV